jgi:hypothetical protein
MFGNEVGEVSSLVMAESPPGELAAKISTGGFGGDHGAFSLMVLASCTAQNPNPLQSSIHPMNLDARGLIKDGDLGALEGYKRARLARCLLLSIVDAQGVGG